MIRKTIVLCGLSLALVVFGAGQTPPASAQPTTAKPANAKPIKAQHLSSLRWRINAPWFGGFSGIEISADGSQLSLVTDRAQFVTARVRRNSDGQIDELFNVTLLPLLNHRGQPLRADTEGLAILRPEMPARSGGYISMETPAAVSAWTRIGTKAQPLPRPDEFHRTLRNKGFEALALSPGGKVIAISEQPAKGQTTQPIWQWDTRGWKAIAPYPRTGDHTGDYLPVGADFGPDGFLYVLERQFQGIGFRSRLLRLDLNAADLAPEVLFTSGTAAHDNLEGVAIWRAPTGELRATMVSDDNFFLLQRTEIVEYTLPERQADRKPETQPGSQGASPNGPQPVANLAKQGESP